MRHEAGSTAPVGPPASHHFWLVDHHDRMRHTADLITTEGQSIVFTRTRHGADRLAKQLGKLGVAAVALHGGRSQNQRTRALDAFVGGRASALVATDVAARGIHVDAVAAVVHYDPAGDTKDYLHRSGRTARAGQGLLTFQSDGRDTVMAHLERGRHSPAPVPRTQPEPTRRIRSQPLPSTGVTPPGRDSNHRACVKPGEVQFRVSVVDERRPIRGRGM